MTNQDKVDGAAFEAWRRSKGYSLTEEAPFERQNVYAGYGSRSRPRLR
jgi:hypothetical protein